MFGATSWVAFRGRDGESWTGTLVPAVGAVGAVAFFGLMAWHLYAAERNTFWSVLVITAVVVAVELLYFEREVLEEVV